MHEEEVWTKIEAITRQMVPFEAFFFNSLSWKNGILEHSGIGTTASGCKSALYVRRIDGLATKFTIEPLCLK